MQSLFKKLKDEELRDKLFIKMLTELSQLSSKSFASELPKYMDLDILKILKEMFDPDVLEEDERSLFSSPITMKENFEGVQKAIIKLLKLN